MDLVSARVPKNVKNGQLLSHGDDSTILANFTDEYIKNEFRSESEGKTIYDHYIQISLQYPGNILTTFNHRFTPQDGKNGNQWTDRFPRQWEAFCSQREQSPDGTPLEIWPPMDKGRLLQLKSMHVHTVEQLAGLTDMTGPNIGLDWRKLRDMAKATLEPSAALVEVAKVSRENEDLRNQMEVMQRQISEMASAKTSNSDNLTPVTLEDDKPRRGRPPKQVSTAA